MHALPAPAPEAPSLDGDSTLLPAPSEASEAATSGSEWRALAQLAHLGALTLLAELVLLRWIPTEMHIFSYMQNVVLLAILMGLGAGSLWARHRAHGWQLALGLLVLTSTVDDPWQLRLLPFKEIAHQLSPFQLDFDWLHASPDIQWLGLRNVGLVVLCLAGVAVTFIPLGQETARRTAEARVTRDACAANLLGSLLGVGLFGLLSALQTGPTLWFAAIFLLSIGLFDSVRGRIATLILLAATVLTVHSARTDVERQSAQGQGPSVLKRWSPYQRITVTPIDWPNAGAHGSGLRMGFNVLANERQYQMMLNLSPTWTRLHPDQYDPGQLGTNPYDLPYRLASAPVRSVLILGAGAGNDAAAALRAGAERIVAVDIDPVILDLGKQLHPESPYSDPRVECVAEDARAWLERSSEQFDLVVLAHVGSVNQDLSHSIRLDSYLYTRESLDLIKQHLKRPHGMLACGISWVQPVLRQRITHLVRDTFGFPPWLHEDLGRTYQYGQRGLTCIGTWPAEQRRISARQHPQAASWTQDPYSDADPSVTPTDDWPYLFLPRRALPTDTIFVSLGLVLFGLLLVGTHLWRQRDHQAPSERRGLACMFALGAGFMLLEVHSTNRALLLLGATWHVQACILAAILLLLLLASRTTPQPERFRAGWWWGALLLSTTLHWALPLARLAALPWGSRAVLGSLLLCLPVYFGSVLYVRLLESSPNREQALGANLLGAFVGGLLESCSFVLGLQAVSLLTLGVYTLAAALAYRLDAGDRGDSTRMAPLRDI